jgi:branched-chain amino acid transport system ATP-binding protein
MRIEQNANRAYVIETGEIQFSGPAQELAADEKIKAVYLGG